MTDFGLQRTDHPGAVAAQPADRTGSGWKERLIWGLIGLLLLTVTLGWTTLLAWLFWCALSWFA